MGYSDGRKQMRRILSIVKRLQKSKGMRVRDLVDFYDVDMTRIYEDLRCSRGLGAARVSGRIWGDCAEDTQYLF